MSGYNANLSPIVPQTPQFATFFPEGHTQLNLNANFAILQFKVKRTAPNNVVIEGVCRSKFRNLIVHVHLFLLFSFLATQNRGITSADTREEISPSKPLIQPQIVFTPDFGSEIPREAILTFFLHSKQ